MDTIFTVRQHLNKWGVFEDRIDDSGMRHVARYPDSIWEYEADAIEEADRLNAMSDGYYDG